MAARGFFRTRFLLCCFKQNSYISKIISTSTTSVNPLYSRQIVSGVQCSSFKGMFKGKTTIDRDADWELKDSQNGYKNGEPTYYHKLSRLIIFATFCGLYLVCSTGTAYAGERDEDKQHDKSRRRHKGCFASKRRIQSVKNLVTAEKGRSQVNENQPEEEKDYEPPRKVKTRSQQQTKHEVDICDTRLIELQALQNDLTSCSSCKGGPLSLVHIVGEKQSGLSSIFIVKCTLCGHLNEVRSSGKHRGGSRGPLVSDINTRAVLGSLHAGMGNTHLNNLLSTMNVPTMNHCLT